MKSLPWTDEDAFAGARRLAQEEGILAGLSSGAALHAALLKWTDVNLRTSWLTIGGRTSKNKQTRRLPLNREALMVLEGWRKQSATNAANPYVFPGAGEGALTTITKSWRSVRKAAGLRNFRFHDLRHHFASRLVQWGVDLNTVRELLGHADLKMVLRYAHLAPGGLASAVEKVARDADQKALTVATASGETASRQRHEWNRRAIH